MKMGKEQSINPMARLIEQPITSTLFKLAAPNAVGFFIASSVSIAEMWFAGRLGTDALAGLALVFPFVMLMQMQSNGSVGGVIAAMVARAMGQGDITRANVILWHSLAVGVVLSTVFSAAFFVFAEEIFIALGGRDLALTQAMEYGSIVFALILFLWLFNMCGSVLRGSGDMGTPAKAMVLAAIVQVIASGALSLGWVGLPALGIKGIGYGTILAQIAGMGFVGWRLLNGRSAVRFVRHALKIDQGIVKDILRNGSIATINPFLTVFSIIAMTAYVGRYGVEAIAGFGIGTRLEFILIPVVFGFGAAMISLVGSNIGAGNVPRAEKVGWRGAGISAGICGLIGLTVAIFPPLWADMFSDDPNVLNVSYLYLRYVGPCYLFFGFGLSLFFASQGAHALTWPVIANFLRCIVAVGGGYLVLEMFDAPLTLLFILISVSLTVYGVVIGGALWSGAWRRANPQ